MAVSRRGLSRGLMSRAFPVSELLDAARDDALQGTVFVDVDAAGFLTGGASTAARCVVRARLAPHVHACNAVLARAHGEANEPGEKSEAGAAAGTARTAPCRVQVVVARDVAPLQELLLWLDEELLAAVDMPFLTLRNIRGRRDYSCHECGARFEEPNPLKTHLFLRCSPPAPGRFWRHLATRLAPASPPTPAPALTSAFRRVTPALLPATISDTARAAIPLPRPESIPNAALSLPTRTLPEAAMARLEALATEWGRQGAARGRGGHACVYCGKLYSRKYGLKIHLRTHTGYRPLRCRHCARAFGDPSNLNKHVRLHAPAALGVGAHACARCGKVLARRRDLERHLRLHCAAPDSAS